jgi:hypothetical protein
MKTQGVSKISQYYQHFLCHLPLPSSIYIIIIFYLLVVNKIVFQIRKLVFLMLINNLQLSLLWFIGKWLRGQETTIEESNLTLKRDNKPFPKFINYSQLIIISIRLHYHLVPRKYIRLCWTIIIPSFSPTNEKSNSDSFRVLRQNKHKIACCL